MDSIEQVALWLDEVANVSHRYSVEEMADVMTQARDRLRALSPAGGGRAFQPGDRIEWQGSNGTWFPGKIVSVRDRVTTYDAKLDDGCDAEDFAAGRFRRIGEVPTPADESGAEWSLVPKAPEPGACRHDWQNMAHDPRFDFCRRCGTSRHAAPTASPKAAAQENEAEAFEAWAAGQKYDMQTHPLHWLFLNERTYAARQGWKAGLDFARLTPASGPTTNSQPIGGKLVERASGPTPAGVDKWLDAKMVKEIIAKYVGRTSRIYLYIANDLAKAHHEALTTLTPAADGEDAAPPSATFIQQVPDRCDRIIWRGLYYCLPVSSQSVGSANAGA